MSWCSDKGIPHSEFLEWSDDDRAKQVAYIMEESSRCSLCGTQPWEWEENSKAYLPVYHTCHGCYVRESFKEDNDSTPGTTVVLRPYSEELVEKERRRYEALRQNNLEEKQAREEHSLRRRRVDESIGG